jgi:hypothetical protein
MFKIIKYLAIGVFIKRNNKNIITFLCLGLFLAVFILIMSDIKAHVADDDIVVFVITKWFITLSVIIIMLWLLSCIFRFKKIKKDPAKSDIGEREEYKGRMNTAPSLQTRGDAIKEKYRKRTNGEN